MEPKPSQNIPSWMREMLKDRLLSSATEITFGTLNAAGILHDVKRDDMYAMLEINGLVYVFTEADFLMLFSGIAHVAQTAGELLDAREYNATVSDRDASPTDPPGSRKRNPFRWN